MNTIDDYVRQLNRNSVSLRSEWLDRLQRVECDDAERAPTPEIVINAHNPSFRTSKDGKAYEPPVTTVHRQEAQSREPAVTTSIRLHAQQASTGQAAAATPQKSPDESWARVDTWQDFDEALQDVTGMSGMPSVSEDDLTQIVCAARQFDAVAANPAEVDRSRASRTASPRRSAGDAEGRTMGIDWPQPPSSRNVCPVETAGPLPEHEFMAAPSEGWHAIPVGGAEIPSGVSTVLWSEAAEPEAAPLSALTANADPPPVASPKSIEWIADRILERFPLTAPSTILLAGTHATIDVDWVAARLAECLAIRIADPVLLVDGNTASRQLSATMGLAKASGLAEVVNRATSLQAVITETDHPRLSFLPCGNGDISWRRLEASRAASLNHALHESCRIAIISGGTCGDPFTRAWAPFADGTCLLVDMENADRDETRRTIERLRRSAVRLIGAVAVRSSEP